MEHNILLVFGSLFHAMLKNSEDRDQPTIQPAVESVDGNVIKLLFAYSFGKYSAYGLSFPKSSLLAQ